MAQNHASIYHVKPVNEGSLVLNGLGDHPMWEEAINLKDFSYPWNEGAPPPMVFKALHDPEWIYGFYRVLDSDALNLSMEENLKTAVLKSDRVEIFLRADEQMDPYYGLEMDALGRTYDFEASFYRKFNAGWSWPKEQLKVRGNINDHGYTLEFALEKSLLTKLNLLKKNKLQAGLFRGKCISLHDGEAEFKWISWVRPDSGSPDFHIPSSFGLLILD
jgi:hypothetical protein